MSYEWTQQICRITNIQYRHHFQQFIAQTSKCQQANSFWTIFLLFFSFIFVCFSCEKFEKWVQLMRVCRMVAYYRFRFGVFIRRHFNVHSTNVSVNGLTLPILLHTFLFIRTNTHSRSSFHSSIPILISYSITWFGSGLLNSIETLLHIIPASIEWW